MSVLIIEDEEIVAHTLKQLFKLRYDTKVTTAETVQIARQTLRNGSLIYLLLITTFQMEPVMVYSVNLLAN